MLRERINQLEKKIEIKVNQEEIDQLKEEIRTVRGQLQVMEEKQRELKEKVVMKSSTNYVSKVDMKKNVTEEIKTRR